MSDGRDAVVASANEIWQRLSGPQRDAHSRRPAELIRDGAAQLQRAKVSNPVVDARLLLGHASAMTPAQLLTAGPLDESVAKSYYQLIEQRAAAVPVQHLTGRAPFRYTELKVGPGVFIPRPETELVAQAAIDEARRRQDSGQDRVQVVELCAGSGAISRSTLDEVPGIELLAVEISAEALSYLQDNLGQDAEIVHADFRDLLALRPQLAGSVDIVVVNPPYVPADEPLDPVVRADPDLALFGGPDGLDVIRDLIPIAAALLAPGGLLILEHGDDQGEAVLELLAAVGFSDAKDNQDLTGRPRYATARTAAEDQEGR